MRIELTDQIKTILLTNCGLKGAKWPDSEQCKNCVLNGVCLEYWTGDDSLNKED